MTITLFSSTNPAALTEALYGPANKGQLSPPVLATVDQNARSLNPDENPSQYSSTNVPILVSGNGASSETAIKRANRNLSHACDSSTYVGKSIGEVGAKAGELMRAVREAVKLALAALGINAASSGIVGYLKKIASYIADVTKFINDITKYVTQFVAYLNAIKQLIAYISSLPAALLKYFADCIALLKKQLVSSYQTALGDTKIFPGTDDIAGPIREVTSSLGDLNKSLANFATQTSIAVASTKTVAPIPTNDPAAQAAATTQIFNAAGFYNTSQNYGKKP